MGLTKSRKIPTRKMLRTARHRDQGMGTELVPEGFDDDVGELLEAARVAKEKEAEEEETRARAAREKQADEKAAAAAAAARAAEEAKEAAALQAEAERKQLEAVMASRKVRPTQRVEQRSPARMLCKAQAACVCAYWPCRLHSATCVCWARVLAAPSP